MVIQKACLELLEAGYQVIPLLLLVLISSALPLFPSRLASWGDRATPGISRLTSYQGAAPASKRISDPRTPDKAQGFSVAWIGSPACP